MTSYHGQAITTQYDAERAEYMEKLGAFAEACAIELNRCEPEDAALAPLQNYDGLGEAAL